MTGLVLFGVLGGAVGCRSAAPPALPDGSWQTGCAPFGKGGRHGLIASVQVEDRRLVADALLHARPDCADPTVRARYVGALHPAEGAPPGAFDHVVEQILLVIEAPSVVEHYVRTDAGCGIDHWAVGVPVEVSGRTCAPFDFPAEGTRLYDWARVDGRGLALGGLPVRWDHREPEQRPTAPHGLRFVARGD